MNKCAFLGHMRDAIITQENNSSRLRFSLAVESKRANNKSSLDENVLSFELWGTAADYLFNHFDSSEKETIDVLVIDATAKESSGEIVFRVNDFRVI